MPGSCELIYRRTILRHKKLSMQKEIDFTNEFKNDDFQIRTKIFIILENML